MVLYCKIIYFLFIVVCGFSLTSVADSPQAKTRQEEKKNLPKSVLKDKAPTLKKSNDASHSTWLEDNLSPVAKKNKKSIKPFVFNVRVLLHKCHHRGSWKFYSEGGFVVSSPGCAQRVRYKKNELHVVVQKNMLFINGKKVVGNNIIISSPKKIITFNHQSYTGIFNIVIENDYGYVINELDIEEYVGCVLHAESWPGWPLEINKAFAIASRSYLISRMLEAEKSKRLFHIKNTNIHQTYKGIHENPVLKQAIAETRGLILTYKKKPVDAMYDCCCGDVIPAHIAGIDFKKAPYLARSYRCTYCKPCKIYTGRAEYSLEEFEKILQAAGYCIKNIRSIKVIKKDKAGIAELIEICGNTVVTLTGKKVYSLFDAVKSWCFSVEKKGRIIVFNGRGYGHHLGICQWGARRMIDFGKKYPAILNFYYPGTLLMQLGTTA